MQAKNVRRGPPGGIRNQANRGPCRANCKDWAGLDRTARSDHKKGYAVGPGPRRRRRARTNGHRKRWRDGALTVRPAVGWQGEQMRRGGVLARTAKAHWPRIFFPPSGVCWRSWRRRQTPDRSEAPGSCLVFVWSLHCALCTVQRPLNANVLISSFRRATGSVAGWDGDVQLHHAHDPPCWRGCTRILSARCDAILRLSASDPGAVTSSNF